MKMAIDKKIKGNQINVVVESPWKKIIIVGIVIIALVVLVELLGKYFEDKGILSFFKNRYITYSVLIIVVIIAVFLVMRFLKRNKTSEVISKGNGSNEVQRVLRIVDRLLEKLPEQEINRFKGSKDAELYKSVLRKHGVR